uniref:tRNA-splicing endonuclease subunit Sen15 domain-containing protein n=1 Tax=Chromera velia CCMP2878 TaxID=1169474 RepID=A0A0G4G8S7_9ALVE|mmetsp:Transcript_32959/g.65253  ORF Transcript_32959/g.65253 Transcript_32959/m.65253 type:complete len:179 (+) Transcript_32959:208-744(+)|eukprot:Cvel_20750.t1-p1 / transcript=Cvel_20750.t1 / gene=Cvel_20750 / organism=Chromera_velia_CCMP2878 / gene_product=hypothetical protein / transcript_product=hypothetical protein / location=Cvel_scaffold1890:27308-29474(+) / protein_length=178 / sequence_SO=supercontig / SO=protein_coding / is_pseudo=false
MSLSAEQLGDFALFSRSFPFLGEHSLKYFVAANHLQKPDPCVKWALTGFVWHSGLGTVFLSAERFEQKDHFAVASTVHVLPLDAKTAVPASGLLQLAEASSSGPPITLAFVDDFGETVLFRLTSVAETDLQTVAEAAGGNREEFKSARQARRERKFQQQQEDWRANSGEKKRTRPSES